MPLAYIALGSNLGDRFGNFESALGALASSPEIQVLRASPVYENRAIGMGAAGDFLNAVAELQTALSPDRLLQTCLEVELQLGRERETGWAPRTIDLDLIHYTGVSLTTDKLVLPHPRLAERDFVAVPLGDLVPDLEISGKCVAEVIRDLPCNELRPTDHKLLASSG